MSKRFKDHYGKLFVGLVLIAVSTVSIMAQRQSDSTTARIDTNDAVDARQDREIKEIMVGVARLEENQKQTNQSQFVLHQKMNELLIQNGVPKARIVEIEMRRDTSVIDSNVYDSTGKL